MCHLGDYESGNAKFAHFAGTYGIIRYVSTKSSDMGLWHCQQMELIDTFTPYLRDTFLALLHTYVYEYAFMDDVVK